jgi:hypothetical protein
MRHHLIRMIAMFAGLLLATESPAQVSFRLLSLPEGREISSVTISRNGGWIGASSVIGTSQPLLHRYSASELVREDLNAWEGSEYYLSRNGISDNGRTMAFMLTRRGNGESRTWGYRWRDRHYLMVRDIFGFTNTFTTVSHMSANGNHIFGVGPNFNNEHEAWRSIDGFPGQDIATGPVGGPGPLNPSCSASGAVAVWSERSGTTSYLWSSATGVQTIRNNVRWNAISASGAVLAGFGSSRTLYIWNHLTGEPTALGSLPGISSLTVNRVAAEGDLLLLANGNNAWVWTQTTGSISLMEYAQSLGVDLTGWSSLLPADVSDDGRMFTGIGFLNGQETPFVFTIPAGSAGSGIAVAAALLVPHRRRGCDQPRARRRGT